MVVVVNPAQQRNPVSLLLDESGDVRVEVRGGAERGCVDRALIAAGAGCLPGHHAELDVTWLLRSIASQYTGGDARALLPADRLDETGGWLEAPVRW